MWIWNRLVYVPQHQKNQKRTISVFCCSSMWNLPGFWSHNTLFCPWWLRRRFPGGRSRSFRLKKKYAWDLVRVFSTPVFRSYENCMIIDYRWQARVCIKFHSTLMSRSDEVMSWLDFMSERLYESFLNSYVLVKRGWESRSESLYESFFNYHVLVKRGWELMRVKKQEFAWEFFQLPCSSHTRRLHTTPWQLRSKSLYEELMRVTICMKVFSTPVFGSKRRVVWELASKGLK